MRCWKPRQTARSSPWCLSSTTATGAGPDPTGGNRWTMWTHAVRSKHHFLDFSQWTFPKGHDMCYDRIDKSGFCNGLHPALVTYTFEPTSNGTLTCTDCFGEEVLNERRSDEEVLCHCKVIGQWSGLERIQTITLFFSGMLMWCGACSLYCCQWALCSSSPGNCQPLRNVFCALRNVSFFPFRIEDIQEVSKGSIESRYKFQSTNYIIWGELRATWREVARILYRAFNPECRAYQQEAHFHLYSNGVVRGAFLLYLANFIQECRSLASDSSAKKRRHVQIRRCRRDPCV